MAIIIIQTRGGDIDIPTPVDAQEANQAIQSQLFDKELAFLCIENHSFSKAEIIHIMVEAEDEEAQELTSTKETEVCYMD